MIELKRVRWYPKSHQFAPLPSGNQETGPSYLGITGVTITGSILALDRLGPIISTSWNPLAGTTITHGKEEELVPRWGYQSAPLSLSSDSLDDPHKLAYRYSVSAFPAPRYKCNSFAWSMTPDSLVLVS